MHLSACRVRQPDAGSVSATGNASAVLDPESGGRPDVPPRRKNRTNGPNAVTSSVPLEADGTNDGTDGVNGSGEKLSTAATMDGGNCFELQVVSAYVGELWFLM